jgi:hypothetical protein
MNRVVTLSFVLLLGSATLAAQVAGQSAQTKTAAQNSAPSKTVLQIRVIDPSACPVEMRAQHGGGGGMVKVGPGDPADSANKMPSQHIRLTLSKANAAAITAATVTVHGFTGKARMVPVESQLQDSSDGAKTIEVAFSPDAANQAAGDFRAPGFTAVTRIDLESVTYADGATWKSDGRVCSVVPDGMMLVSAR